MHAFGFPFVAVASKGLDGRSVGGTAFPYRWAQGTGRGRPSRPCKHESSRKLRGRGNLRYPLPLSISGMTFGRKRKLNKEKESGRKAQTANRRRTLPLLGRKVCRVLSSLVCIKIPSSAQFR